MKVAREDELDLLTRAQGHVLQLVYDHEPLTSEQEDRIYILLSLEMMQWGDDHDKVASLNTLEKALPTSCMPLIEDLISHCA